jgi:hypothetical protein
MVDLDQLLTEVNRRLEHWEANVADEELEPQERCRAAHHAEELKWIKAQIQERRHKQLTFA